MRKQCRCCEARRKAGRPQVHCPARAPWHATPLPNPSMSDMQEVCVGALATLPGPHAALAPLTGAGLGRQRRAALNTSLPATTGAVPNQGKATSCRPDGALEGCPWCPWCRPPCVHLVQASMCTLGAPTRPCLKSQATPPPRIPHSHIYIVQCIPLLLPPTTTNVVQSRAARWR